MKTTISRLTLLCAAVGILSALGAFVPAEQPGYVVVVSQTTYADPGWKPVVDALVAEHQATVATYEKSVDESLEPLRQAFPRYTGFVATPAEATRAFVAEVHALDPPARRRPVYRHALGDR